MPGVRRHLFFTINKVMDLNKSLFIFVLSISLLGCGKHKSKVQTVSRNIAQQSTSESKPQSLQIPSPIITPTPELEITFCEGLRIVPRTVELKNESRRYRIDVVYPQIEGRKSRGILNLNHQIKDLVTKQYQWLLIPPTKEDYRHYQKWPGVFNSLDLEYEVVLATDELLSIYFEAYVYGIGAAHSVQYSFTVNYDLSSDNLLKLANIFKPNINYLQFVSQYCMNELTKRHGEYIWKDALAPKVKNYQSWNITKEGITINFDACAVVGCAGGKQEVKIPFVILKDMLSPNSAAVLLGK